MGNKCDKMKYKDMSSDQKETYHWNTWIRYIPALNIAYGSIRCFVYAVKVIRGWKNGTYNSQHGKEFFKSFCGAIAGVLGIFVAGLVGGLVSSVISNALAAMLTTLAAEMITGAFVQNLIITLGDIVTSFEILKKRTSDQWEELINSEICIKVPFIGILYSLIRAVVYNCKGNSEVTKDSVKNALINAVGSALGLAAGYGFHLAACHPRVTDFCHKLCEEGHFVDDLGRTIAQFSVKKFTNGSEFLLAESFRVFGEATGTVGESALHELNEHLKMI